MQTKKRLISLLVAMSMIAALIPAITMVSAVALPTEASRTWVPVAGTWVQEGGSIVGQGNATDYWKQIETKASVIGDFTFTTKFKLDFTGAAAANRYYFVLRDQGGTVIKDNVKPEIAAGGIGIVFTRADLGGRMFFFDGYENRTARYFNEYDAGFQMIDAEGYVTMSISIIGNVVSSLKINGNEISGIRLTADLETDPLRPLSDIVLPAAVDGKITAGQFLSNPAVNFVLTNETLESSGIPTSAPTAAPTAAPTVAPTVAPTAAPTAVPSEWEDYQAVTAPSSMFWGDSGTWTGSYTATSGDENDNAVSYTDFGLTAGGDDIYNLTNYRVKFDIIRPATGQATPGFVVGAKNRAPFGGTTSYDCNAMAHGLSIAKFGDWMWSSYYFNSVNYNTLGNPQPGDVLTFEVIVTPNNLKLYVNNYLIANDTTTNNKERGLFGLSSRNIDLSNATFSNIFYSRRLSNSEPDPTSTPAATPTSSITSAPDATPTPVTSNEEESDNETPQTGDENVNIYFILLAIIAAAAISLSLKKLKA